MNLFHIPQCSIEKQKCVCEWSIVEYDSEAFWDMWIRSIGPVDRRDLIVDRSFAIIY